MYKILKVIILMLLLASGTASANDSILPDSSHSTQSDPLKGLKKATFSEIDPSEPIMLDGVSIPVYSDQLIRLQGEDFMKTMMTRDFIPDPYIDQNKEVKAFVLRKATEQEKKEMVQFDTDSLPSSEWIGKDAFPFSVIDISGNEYSLEKMKGKIIVLNFWFVECKPCVMEIPELNKLVEKYNREDVVFLGVSHNSKSQVDKFLKTKAFNYHIIADNQELAELYQVLSYPTHVIIDKNSKVAYLVNGYGPTTISELDEKIGELAH